MDFITLDNIIEWQPSSSLNKTTKKRTHTSPLSPQTDRCNTFDAESRSSNHDMAQFNASTVLVDCTEEPKQPSVVKGPHLFALYSPLLMTLDNLFLPTNGGNIYPEFLQTLQQPRPSLVSGNGTNPLLVRDLQPSLASETKKAIYPLWNMHSKADGTEPHKNQKRKSTSF